MDKTTIEALCNVLEGRADFYLTLAGYYYKPLTQQQIDALAETDFEALMDGSLMGEGFDDMRRVLRKRHTGTRRILATEWTSTFGGAEAYKGRYCVPNASVFLDKSGSTYGWPRNAASRIYREQHLRLADNAGMPESHLTFELEFLAVLSREIIVCMRAGELDEALAKVQESRRFIDESILSWFPEMQSLALLMLKTRFYRGVMKLTEGYLTLDCETLDDLAALLCEAGARTGETGEACADVQAQAQAGEAVAA